VSAQATILVAEDDASLRVVIRMVLEREGYLVVDARNGSEAITAMEGRRLPDLVLADMRMPIMGGVELIQRIRANPRTASIPVVLLSGFSKTGESEADAVIVKPFDPGRLVDVIRGLLERPPP
jgi:CheY-like chemotaxis protein